jgi:hypothetical protein
MPGLDFVTSALQRIGLFGLWVHPSNPPTTDVSSTVWLKTSSTSWSAEGSIFLYNATTATFEPATPALWRAIFVAASGANVFQSVTGGAAAVNALTTLLAVERDNPGLTGLTLPSVVGRSQSLQIVDWSTNVAAHEVRLAPWPGETIMRRAQFSIWSNADQLGGVTLYPSVDLLGWVIAP